MKKRTLGLGIANLLAVTTLLCSNANSAPTIAVTNAAQLAAALTAAKGGETILLAPGNYGRGNFDNRKYASEVTIASADSTHRAVFGIVTVVGSKNLTFRALEMTSKQTAPSAMVWVSGVENVKFDRVEVYGNVDDHRGNDGSGIVFSGVKNGVIQNSNLHDLYGAIGANSSDGVVIANNYIHDVNQDAIQSSATSNLAISKNYITDMWSWVGAHKDAIQLFTQGQKTPTRNVLIENNTFFRGKAQQVQGIFMGNEAKIPYENVTIRGNSIIGGSYHGITIVSGKNVKLVDNLVQGYKDMESWIQGVDLHDSVISDNVSTSYVIRNNPGTVATNNTKISLGTVGDSTVLAAWQLTHPNSATLSSVWETPTTPANPTPTPVPTTPTTPTPAPAPAPTQPTPPAVTLSKGTLTIKANARLTYGTPTMQVFVDGKSVGTASVTANLLANNQIGTYKFDFTSATKPKTVEITMTLPAGAKPVSPPLMVLNAGYGFAGKAEAEVVKGKATLAKQLAGLAYITNNGDLFYTSGTKIQIDVSGQ